MPGFSGKTGTTKKGGSEFYEVNSWNFNPSTNVPKYASNLTGGFKRGISAVRDSNGTVEVKIQENASMPFHDGDQIALELHGDDSGNNYIEVTAIISGTPINVDIDNGEPVSATYNFEGSLAWTGHGIFSSGGGSSSGT